MEMSKFEQVPLSEVEKIMNKAVPANVVIETPKSKKEPYVLKTVLKPEDQN